MQRTLIAALAMSSALLLVGCEDEPEPRFEPSTTEASSETAIEPTDVETTDAARQLSPTEVVRGWVDELNAALRGDPHHSESFTTNDCKTCEQQIGPIAETVENGGWYRGGDWSVIRARVAARSEEQASVYTAISAAKGAIALKPRAAPRRFPADKFILDFRLERVDSDWVIAQIVLLQ